MKIELEIDDDFIEKYGKKIALEYIKSIADDFDEQHKFMKQVRDKISNDEHTMTWFIFRLDNQNYIDFTDEQLQEDEDEEEIQEWEKMHKPTCKSNLEIAKRFEKNYWR